MSGYVGRHYAGLSAAVSRLERDRVDTLRAAKVCAAVDTPESLALAARLTAGYAKRVAGTATGTAA